MLKMSALFNNCMHFYHQDFGEIRGPLVDQIGAASHIKRHQIGLDEKGFFSV
jgi:hypothetical protein